MRLRDARDPGVADADVGGAAHNVGMNEFENCERCDGSGADPVQSFFDDEFTFCRDCRGDGRVLSFEERVHELLAQHDAHEQPLRLSA
jgi:DnaJ-class molecular chaperone